MGRAEEPLFRAIVIAHHEPDPERAFRYKPFLPKIARISDAGGVTEAPGRQAGHPGSRRLDVVAAVRRLLPGWGPANAPSCPPASW